MSFLQLRSPRIRNTLAYAPIVIVTATGDIKVWNGSTFTTKPVKVWDGSTWAIKPIKRWNGSAWVATTY